MDEVEICNIKEDPNMKAQILKNLGEQFIEETKNLSNIVSYVLQEHKSINKILIVDDIENVQDCHIEKMPDDTQYAVCYIDGRCYIENEILFKVSEFVCAPNNSLFMQQYHSLIAASGGIINMVYLRRLHWKVPNYYYNRRCFVIDRIRKIESTVNLNVIKIFIRIQLEIFYEKLITIHFMFRKDKYYIVDKIDKISGQYKDVFYEVVDDKVYIINHDLSNTKMTSSKIYTDTLPTVVKHRVFTGYVAMQYHVSEIPFVTIEKIRDEVVNNTGFKSKNKVDNEYEPNNESKNENDNKSDVELKNNNESKTESNNQSKT